MPKAKRHDHLPGAKGYFHASALQASPGPLWVCECPFDALALLAAGVPRVVAIFGGQGWRWDWGREVRALVFALDADTAGQQQWRQLARQAALRGKRVAVLEPAVYGGYKDVNEAWMAGVLHLGVWPAARGAEPGAVPENLCEDWAERAAIMVADGGLPPAEAERLAWRGPHATESHTYRVVVSTWRAMNIPFHGRTWSSHRTVLVRLTTLARQRTMRLWAGWQVVTMAATSQHWTRLMPPGAREHPRERAMHVIGFDHMVVNTHDLEQALHFYRDVLGLELLRLEEFRAGNVGFVSARVAPETIIDIRPIPAGERVTPNMDHYCLVLRPTDMHQLHAELQAQGIKVEETVRPAWGAQGYGQQFKLWDPDGNKIELRSYTDAPGA